MCPKFLEEKLRARRARPKYFAVGTAPGVNLESQRLEQSCLQLSCIHHSSRTLGIRDFWVYYTLGSIVSTLSSSGWRCNGPRYNYLYLLLT